MSDPELKIGQGRVRVDPALEIGHGEVRVYRHVSYIYIIQINQYIGEVSLIIFR